jgi:hypothetical protein
LLNAITLNATDVLTQLSTESTTTVEVEKFIISTICSIIIGFLISGIYMFTHRKIGFEQSHVITIVALPVVVGTIIMLVGNTAQAFSLAGVFSLVRFRSGSIESSDICYIFFSVAAGLACGTGYVQYAFLFLVLLGLVLIIMNRLDFGKPTTKHMTLKISIPENLNYLGLFDEILNKYCTGWTLNRVKTTEFGSQFDLVFNVEVRNSADQKKFLDELRTLNGNLNITLVLNRKDDKLYA